MLAATFFFLCRLVLVFVIIKLTHTEKNLEEKCILVGVLTSGVKHIIKQFQKAKKRHCLLSMRYLILQRSFMKPKLTILCAYKRCRSLILQITTEHGQFICEKTVILTYPRCIDFTVNAQNGYHVSVVRVCEYDKELVCTHTKLPRISGHWSFTG